MTAKQLYDAIVVGGGPAGSTAAALLARQGFTVLVVDRASFPREKACGEYTSPQTEQALERTGALDLVACLANHLDQMHFFSPSGRRFVLDYGSAASGGKTVLATARTELDTALLEHARRSGAEIRERARVNAVSLTDGKVSGILLRRKDGGTEKVAARLVIGADGTHSVVARSLRLVAPVKWPRSLGMVARFEGHNGLEDHGEMHVSARGYAGLAPLRGGLVNVGLVMPMERVKDYQGSSASERFERFAFSFPGVAERLAGARRVSEVRGSGPIGARVRRTYGNGFLLVGDAAGFFDPFTGEGVYKAIRGAELAAHVAGRALEANDLSARRLAAYSALRRREFGAKDLVCRMVQMFVGLPPAMDYVAGRLAARQEPREVLTGVLGDYEDPKSALTPGYLWSVLRP